MPFHYQNATLELKKPKSLNLVITDLKGKLKKKL